MSYNDSEATLVQGHNSLSRNLHNNFQDLKLKNLICPPNLPVFNTYNQEAFVENPNKTARYYSYRGKMIDFSSNTFEKEFVRKGTDVSLPKDRKSKMANIINLNLSTERVKRERGQRLEKKSKIHQALNKNRNIIKAKTRNNLTFGMLNNYQKSADGLYRSKWVLKNRNKFKNIQKVSRRTNNFSIITMIPKRDRSGARNDTLGTSAFGTDQIKTSFKSRNALAKRSGGKYTKRVLEIQSKCLEHIPSPLQKYNISEPILNTKNDKKKPKLSLIGGLYEPLYQEADGSQQIRIKIKKKNLFKLPNFRDGLNISLGQKF
ncbi:unnamed protein product [Moneuplotes crassus]|uniref:Uncharacterized protein n=1 Tax=Euplotes crassus TaxID=5936 RepID=A0AAD1XFZ3_EUPCR|nr:unnamed protein product [Moneuplotes crassus]